MRITGGRARGITLQTPRGQKTRPAADAMRESLFSSLGERIVGSHVADLYAGTGSYGLEAYSRGAISAQFVESDSRCVQCINENMRRVAKSCGSDIRNLSAYKVDVLKWKGYAPSSLDVLFADPPYDYFPALVPDLFRLAEKLLKLDGLLIIEKPADLELPDCGWQQIKQLGKRRGKGPSVGIWKQIQGSS